MNYPEGKSLLFLDDDKDRRMIFKSLFPWATIVITIVGGSRKPTDLSVGGIEPTQ